MTDITDRLRAAVPKLDGIPVGWRCEVRSDLLLEAAAEVERLRAVVATLEIVGKAADDERAKMRAEVERLTRERDEARAKASKLRAVLEMVRDADNDCRVEGWATIPDAARQGIDEALEAKP